MTCYVLFDVTPSGVTSRRQPDGMDEETWLHKRDTQCNLDTILQVISLRSQPEIVRQPEYSPIKFDDDRFGFLYEQIEDEEYPCWSFDFDIQHPGVFANDIDELGLLYGDCDMVPMIKCGTEWAELPLFLDTTVELRNIYFKVTDEKTEQKQDF